MESLKTDLQDKLESGSESYKVTLRFKTQWNVSSIRSNMELIVVQNYTVNYWIVQELDDARCNETCPEVIWSLFLSPGEVLSP